MEHQVAGSGQAAFEADPGLCTGMASAIDPASDGREGSQVPPEGRQATHIEYGRGGRWSQLELGPTAPSQISVQAAGVDWQAGEQPQQSGAQQTQQARSSYENSTAVKCGYK